MFLQATISTYAPLPSWPPVTRPVAISFPTASPMLFGLSLLDDSLFQSMIVTEPVTLHSHFRETILRNATRHRNNIIAPISLSLRYCSQSRHDHDYLETFTPSQPTICISTPSHPAQIQLFPLHPLTSSQSNHLKPTFASQAITQSSQWSSRAPLLLRVSNLPLPSTLTSILTQPQLPPVAAALLCKSLTYTPPNRTIPHHHNLTPFVCQSG